MLFKLDRLRFVGLFTFALFFNSRTFAEDRKPSYALDLPVSTSAAMNGVGAAAPGDVSVMDVNPALLSAIKKQYTLFGDTGWQKYLDVWDAGVFDSVSSPVAAALRARQSVPEETSRDVRYTLALAYQIPKTNVSFGVSGNMEHLGVSNYWSEHEDERYFFGTGVFYTYHFASGRPLFLGASVNKIFDKLLPVTADLGAAVPFFDGIYTASFDVLTNAKSGTRNFTAGLGIAVNPFFDLKGSVGYTPKDSRTFWGGGIFFNAPLLHLYYTFAKMDAEERELRHSAGCQLTFTM